MNLEDRNPKCLVTSNTLQPNTVPSNKQPCLVVQFIHLGDVPIIISQIFKQGSNLLPMSPRQEINLRRNVVLVVVADLCETAVQTRTLLVGTMRALYRRRSRRELLPLPVPPKFAIQVVRKLQCSYLVSLYVSRETPIATLRSQTSSLIFPSSSCST